jgi:CubicO group peptidase (beta-lactamase class C family)
MRLKMSKQNSWILILIPLILATVTSPVAGTHFSPFQSRDYWPTMGWRALPPEAQGMSSNRLDELWNQMNAGADIGGFVLIRNGYLLYEVYYPGTGPDYLWRLASIAKSFTAGVLGVALADGYISSINASVLNFFSDRTIANPDPRKDAMTLRHLLTMSSGFESNAATMGMRPDWIQYLLDLPMVHEPGEVWKYDGGCPHLISAIITQTTGMSMAELARVRLFTPMGISNYEWDADPQGNTIGFGNLALSLRDLAKFGFLYLNNGTWGPYQLVSAEWVAECTKPHFLFSNGFGYGYQWWVDPEISGYSMRGAGGMRVFIIPEQDLVLVIAGAVKSSYSDFYSVFEEYLFPAIIGDPVNVQPSVEEQTLPFVVVLLLVVIPLIVGNMYRQRRGS